MNDITDIDFLRAFLAGFHEDDSWEFWASKGKVVNAPYIGTITVVDYIPSLYPDGGVPVRIIFRVDDTFKVKYYAKTGYENSYGTDIEWTGEFRQVAPEEKVVLEYV